MPAGKNVRTGLVKWKYGHMLHGSKTTGKTAAHGALNDKKVQMLAKVCQLDVS